MKIEIDKKYDAMIRQKVDAGEFTSAEDLVVAALQKMTQADGDFAPGELDELLKPAFEQLRRGESVPFEQAMQVVRRRINDSSDKRSGA
ncbi:MAG TPA: hypothetical protein VF595_10030 [Tepidisphaeraceae bacterium]|jgi:Arc/MetJ-type ribon-helix-helix transcriptional regulator